jgi:hypothetical protein
MSAEGNSAIEWVDGLPDRADPLFPAKAINGVDAGNMILSKKRGDPRSTGFLMRRTNGNNSSEFVRMPLAQIV